MFTVQFPNPLDSIGDSAEWDAPWEPTSVVVVACSFIKLVVAEYLDSFVPIFCSIGDDEAPCLCLC